MMLYTAVPLEQIWQGYEQEVKPTMEIALGGVIMEVEPLNAKQVKMVRLISPNAQDYLNPRFAPGTIMEWNRLEQTPN